MRRRQQRDHSGFLWAGEHYQGAGIGQRVIGGGDPHIRRGAQRAQLLAIGDAGMDAGQRGDPELHQAGSVGGHRLLAFDSCGHGGARIGRHARLRRQSLDAGDHRSDAHFHGDFRDAQPHRWRLGGRLLRAAPERGPDAVQNRVARHQRSLHISRKLFEGGGGRSRWLSHARTGGP